MLMQEFKKIIAILLPVFASVVLASCNAPQPEFARVKTELLSHPVVYEEHAKHLTDTEFNALRIFVQSLPSAGISYVGLMTDDMNSEAEQHAEQIKKYLIHAGIAPEVIHLQQAFGSDGHTIIVAVQYDKIIPPAPCPDWSKNSIANYNNTRASGFGCSYENNIAVQLTNPADLEHGNGTDSMSPVRDSISVQKYNAGIPMPIGSMSAGTPSSSAGAATANSSNVSSLGSISGSP